MAKKAKPSQRAVIYARFSSHNQRSESIEIQVEKSTAYCRDRGLQLVGVYADEAHTGRDTNRAEYQRMLDDAMRGLFDYVVIYKVTRIMRNRDEMALLRMMLKRCGVEIMYSGESIPEDTSGRTLMLGLLEVLAEWESDMNSERTRDGIRKNAERLMANGQTLYGWKIVDGYYEIEPEEHRHLVMMKDMLLDGRMIADIVRASEPYRTHRGKKFTQSGITQLLKREQNAGVYDYAGVHVVDGMPAQWPQAEQDRIMAVLAKNERPRKTDNTAHFPLSGMLVHGDCGRPMVGHCGTSHTGKRYYYYKCKGCRKQVRKEDIEAEVMAAIVDTLSSTEVRERIADLVMAAEDERLKYEPKLTATIDKELAEIERAYANIWKAIEAGVAPPGGKDRIDALQAREGSLREQREAAAKLEAVRIDRERVLFWLEGIAGMEPERAIETFVARVTWHGEGRIDVAFTFDGGPEDPPGLPPDGTDPPGCTGSFDAPPVVLPDGSAGSHKTTGRTTRVYVFWRGFVLAIR